MQPRLMNINEFVTKNKIKQVSSIRRYSGNKIDENGLFSEDIFGRQGAKDRRERFGFIDVKTPLIHPEAWNIVTRISTDFLKCIKSQVKYIVSRDKFLLESEDGDTGLYFFTKVLPKLDLNYYIKKDKKKQPLVDYTKKNMDAILTNKVLVLPAGIRDIRISRASGKTFIEASEINTVYENLIRQSHSIVSNAEDLPKDIVEPIVTSMQRNYLEINNWIKNRIKGKQGLIRGGLFSKRTDYSGRLVVTGDPTLKMGYIGLPWQVVLIIFEPFTINYLLYKDRTGIPLIQQEMKIENPPDITDVKRLLKKAKDNPKDILAELKLYLIETAKEVSRDKQVLYKRDPVLNRDSWLSAYVRIDSDGHVIKLNPFDFPRTGGDCDGDTYVIYSLLTKEAQEEAKNKMNPRHSKGMWNSVTNAGKCPYSIELDAATAIYSVTKN
jgi:DNA-directed RNA polymerase beta' subunit